MGGKIIWFFIQQKEHKKEVVKDNILDQLTFYDGVILTHDIFKKLIEYYLDNEVAWEYLSQVDDAMYNILTNNILNPTITRRAENLQDIFGIGPHEFRY